MINESNLKLEGFPWIFPVVINLSSRTDRLQEARLESRKLGIEFLRLAAVEAEQIPTGTSFLSREQVACWKSHFLALEEFVNSGFDYALILEDDFIVNKTNEVTNLLSSPKLFSNVDILQLGFLINDYRDFITLKLNNFDDSIFYILAKIRNLFRNTNLDFLKRTKVDIRRNRPRNWVSNDLRAGAHAYIVSRNAALKILEINNPPFLATDNLLVSLNSVHSLRIFRTRKSLIGQSDSPSNIRKNASSTSRKD